MITATTLLASGGYKKSPRGLDTSNYKKADKNYSYFKEDPKPKSEKDLKSHLFSIPRSNISIHNIEYSQTLFSIVGTYQSANDLNNFIEKLKKTIGSDKSPDLKTHSTHFAGSKTLHYEITAENLF